MRALFVVANRTGTAWWSHVEDDTGRVMWTRKIEYATAFGEYAAKRVAKKYGGTVRERAAEVRGDEQDTKGKVNRG